MSEACVPHHDTAANLLTAFLCVGITVSYLPQHLRMILTKSSEGFSPWFLLLGSTSSASAMLNIIVVQWGLVKCCREVSVGQCIESTAGIFQVFLVWFLFVMILVLYMIYYPPHLKYTELDVPMPGDLPPAHVKTPVLSDEWRISIILSWVVFIHILLEIFVSFLLLTTGPRPKQISAWATFLGVSSACFATLQYLPQLIKTWRLKLVGSLSILSMLMQSPGAVLMILSVALRPDTDWTTWLVYAVAGVLQGTLLIMCIFWRFRQQRLGIDDFGNPLVPVESASEGAVVEHADSAELQEAVQAATLEELAEGTGSEVGDESERAPLLGGKKRSGGWKSWLRR